MKHFWADEEHFIAVVGDRILSDVVLGNHLGMFTIYVSPLDVTPENSMVRLVRCFEDTLLSGLTSGLMPLSHPLIEPEHYQ